MIPHSKDHFDNPNTAERLESFSAVSQYWAGVGRYYKEDRSVTRDYLVRLASIMYPPVNSYSGTTPSPKLRHPLRKLRFA